MQAHVVRTHSHTAYYGKHAISNENKSHLNAMVFVVCTCSSMQAWPWIQREQKSSRKFVASNGTVSIFLSIFFGLKHGCGWECVCVHFFFHYKCNSFRQIAIQLMQRSLDYKHFDSLNSLNMKSLCKLLSNFGISIAKTNKWNKMSENSTRDESLVVGIIVSYIV